jgi:preprotein translocase subunit SecG
VGMGANAGKPNVLSKILSIDPVTKITIGLGILLMLNSLILANMSSRKYKKENSSRVEDYIKNVEKSEDNEKESDRETINNLIEQKGLVGDEEKKESAESSQQGNK